MEEETAVDLDLFSPKFNSFITVIYSTWDERSAYACFCIEIHDHTPLETAKDIVRRISESLPDHEIIQKKEKVAALT